MKRAGQYAIVEQTVLLGVGIAIAVGFLLAFETIGDDISSGTSQAETTLLSQFIAANTVELVESGAEGKYIMQLPDSIVEQGYAIRIDDTGVNVITRGTTGSGPLYGLENRITMDGQLTSQSTATALVYENGSITLEEEQ